MFLRGALPLACWFLLVGCGQSVTEAECQELLDRYTDKQIDQARPSTTRAERMRLLRAARERAVLDPEFRACPERLTRHQFDCAMTAHNADQIERCLL